MKMEKTPRYTQRERNMVLGFAAQYKDVIENKRTDAESNRKKDEVWRQIAKDFNTRVYHQRSSKQLRQLYKNMKLLLKKDLCGEGKGNRTFMDLLNTLSQQESVAQYISEQLSPSGGGAGGGAYSNNGRPHKFDDDYDDSKNPFSQLAAAGYDSLDPDVIVIKSEDISDNDQSQHGGNLEDMDDDDGDGLSSNNIPEVCLEEEDDEIFATDLRQSTPLQQSNQRHSFQGNGAQQSSQQQLSASQQSQQQPPSEIALQSTGGIRVGSIGSLANLKALQNGNNSALSITPAYTNNNGCNGNANSNGSSGGGGNMVSNSSNSRQTSAEQQAAQQLLLNGLGLSAVNATPEPPLPTLQRAGHNNSVNQLLLSMSSNGGYVAPPPLPLPLPHKSNSGGNSGTYHQHGNNNSSGSSGGGVGGTASSAQNAQSRHNDYLMSLAIEERKRKIDLLNAQIEYWKTLTKKLDANAGHNPTPACLCHFPGNVNGLQTPAGSS